MPSHVIIGSGPAATNAIETIRQFDLGESSITLVSDEPAHSRMALPYWISGQIPREQTHTGDASYFQRLRVETRFGRRATSIDTGGKRVILDDGQSLVFDNLLLATGSAPIKPTLPGADLSGVQPMWTLEHAAQALERTESIERPRVVLVGAGFIGFIVLNAMHKRGWRLTVVEREAQVLPRMLDSHSAELADQWLHSRDINVFCNDMVKEIRALDGSTRQVVLASGKTIDADLIVLAIGIRPNVELAQSAGLSIDQGIVVNHRMQTSVPFIYAAGDVAQGPVLGSSQTEVHAIQPTAVDHGRVAGANMAGQSVLYPGSLLINVVDICGLQTASFGNWSDASAEAMIIQNTNGRVYRKLLWTGDQITGAIFAGRPNDMGMLNDVGMVKGLIQTQTHLGPWKDYLAENPFDIRRAYVACGVAQKLIATTLLGRPTRPRDYRFGEIPPTLELNPSHAAYVGTKRE